MTQQHTERMVTEFEPLPPAHQGPAGGIETPNQPRGSDTMGTMTNDETYNGYANRETWAFNLHWQNDQGLYNETLELAGDYVQRKSIASHAAEEPTNYELGEMVADFWHQYISDIESEGGILPAGLRAFRDEVGSWWRIDYAEVGAAVRESLSAEGE